ncbi:MAG: hypothetical protein RQM90_05525 [Methanoculleus sp.]
MDGRTCKKRRSFAYSRKPAGDRETMCGDTVLWRMAVLAPGAPIRAVGAPGGCRTGYRDRDR